MTIITISRGSYSRGRVIAEAVAGRLGFECVSRDVLLEASAEFDIPEVKLVRALHDAPSVLERFTHGRQKYIAFIRSAFLERVRGDNVVYHGLAGHFFLAGVSHVLKVRILSDIEDRVACEIMREGCSRDDALRVLKKDDYERRKWSSVLYGIDTFSPSLYDVVLHVRKLTVGDAVDFICNTAGLEQFQTTEASQRTLDNLALASRVKSAIVRRWPDAEVSADGQDVVVHTEAPLVTEQATCRQIEKVVRTVPGVRGVRIDVRPTMLSL